MVNPNIIPIHPNPTVKKNVNETLEKYVKITLTELSEYDQFVYGGRASDFLSDAGGMQRETSPMGELVLVLNDKIARSKAITSGTARLIGTVISSIVDAVNLLRYVQDEYILMSKAINPLGDGTASIKIISVYPKSINA